MRPVPMTPVILFFLNRKAMPSTFAFDRLVLVVEHRRQVEFRRHLDAQIAGSACPASANISEACSSAFDGMQPTFRQVPP